MLSSSVLSSPSRIVCGLLDNHLSKRREQLAAVLLVEYFPTFRKVVVPSSSFSNSPSGNDCWLLDKYLSKRREPFEQRRSVTWILIPGSFQFITQNQTRYKDANGQRERMVDVGCRNSWPSGPASWSPTALASVQQPCRSGLFTVCYRHVCGMNHCSRETVSLHDHVVYVSAHDLFLITLPCTFANN